METERLSDRNLDDIGTYLGKALCGSERVADILDVKGRQVHTVTHSATVFDALRVMARHDVGALVVLRGSIVEGIVSERDYARKVILIGKSSSETTVGEIMSTPAWTVKPDETVAGCLALVTGKRVRHLPVVDAGLLAGIVSIGDLVKAVIAEQGLRIEQFERYIQGAYPS